MKRFSFLLLAVVFVATSCSSGNSRADALKKLADQKIVPAYQDASQSAEQLVSKVRATCSGGAPADLIASVDAMRNSWARSEAMWVGPVMDNRLASRVDFEIDTDAVDKLLADTSKKVDSTSLVSRAANERGIEVIDYLASKYSLADARVCSYATSVAEVAQSATRDALNGWTQGSEPYTKTFTKDSDKSIDSLVNDSVNLLQMMSDMQLGAGIGRNGKAGDPAAIPEGSSGNGAQYQRERLKGLRAVIAGDSSTKGLSGLLDADLVTRLNTAFDNADKALADINGPLRTAATDNKAAVEKAKTAIDEVRRIESTEVVSKLGVTVGFSDSDGDSAG